jgi:hypothetical protein
MAIAIVGVRGKRYHNTLFGTGQSIRIAPDERLPWRASEAELANNVLDHAITGFRSAGVSSRNELSFRPRRPRRRSSPRGRGLSGCVDPRAVIEGDADIGRGDGVRFARGRNDLRSPAMTSARSKIRRGMPE